MNLARAQEGAAHVATAVAESVQYQGRKASRHGSEQRRQQILDAAMRIVVRDGVRGVRHRAVAAEAGVPLSATTYYFKDIDDLLIHGLTGKNSNNSVPDKEIEYIKEFKNQYPNISISQFRDIYLEDIIFVELKTTKKYLPENPKGFFFGATENEFKFGDILGYRFRFCFVCLNEKSPSFALQTIQELEQRIKNKRIQFQINL